MGNDSKLNFWFFLSLASWVFLLMDGKTDMTDLGLGTPGSAPHIVYLCVYLS